MSLEIVITCFQEKIFQNCFFYSIANGSKCHKNGITCRRKTAGWDNKYLLKVLTADKDFIENSKTA